MRLVDTVFCVDCLSPGALRRIPQKTSVFVYIVYPQYQGKLCPSLCLFYQSKGIVEVMTTDGFIFVFTVEVDQPPTAAVRRFLDLLEQSDIDFSEELGKWRHTGDRRVESCSLCLEIYLAAPLHV